MIKIQSSLTQFSLFFSLVDPNPNTLVVDVSYRIIMFVVVLFFSGLNFFHCYNYNWPRILILRHRKTKINAAFKIFKPKKNLEHNSY